MKTVKNLQPKQDHDQREELFQQSEETATVELSGEQILQLLERDDLDAIETVSGIGKGVIIGLALWAVIIVGLIILF